MKKLYFILTLFVVLVGACKKETGIGADLLPGDDLLFAKNTDTFTLYSKTISDTALRTDKLSKNYLGIINDPIFGDQKASFAIELSRGDLVYDDSLRPGGGYTIDSVVLFIRYNGIYGDSTVGQDFKVSTISTAINENIAYYSNNTSFPAGTLLGSTTGYTFAPTQKTILSTTDTVGTPQIFRIKLDAGGSESLFKSLIDLPASQLRDSLNFKNNFPGILVENSSSAGKAMIEMDLSNANSSVTIFYKDKYSKQKTMRLKTSQLVSYKGSIINRQNGINFFSTNFSSSVNNVVTSGLVSDSINYVLGQGGTLVKISLPTISNLGKVAVNKAVLSVTQIQNNSEKDFFVPYLLILLKRNTDGVLDIIPTYSSSLNYPEGASFADSVATDGFGNKLVRYNLNITKYIQSLSLGTDSNTDLYLATYRSGGIDGTINTLYSSALNSSGYSPYRSVIAGSNYSDDRFKMKLNITYTLLK
jgi:hypothetical protein